MGLDMFLYAGIGPRYVRETTPLPEQFVQEYTKLAKCSPIESPPKEFRQFEIGYWRKANAIHGWFVDNVQDGTDDCGEYLVTRHQLQTLRNLCDDLLALSRADLLAVAQVKLPPRSGFFFGTYEIDEDYRTDLVDTVEILDKALGLSEPWVFKYEASW